MMLRVWKESYTRPNPVGGAAALSAAAHVLVIGVWVSLTLPSATMETNSIANRVFYIPPPDRRPLVAGGLETVHYVEVATGAGLGPGPSALDARLPAKPMTVSADPGVPPDTAAAAIPGNNPTTTDSVFTVVEVDTAVVRSQNSAAPTYPPDLLAQRIQGSVRVRYVVDTTGYADPSSIQILAATDPGFAASVRDVLPHMLFSPAKIGERKVRQLVEQSFAFHIAAPAAAGAKPPPTSNYAEP